LNWGVSMNEAGSPGGLTQPDASQRSAGQMLRRERENQGLTVEALSSIIKVTPARILSLESDQLAKHADANFTRALAQTVCRALKIDPAPVLRALPPAEPARLHEAHAPLNQPLPQRGTALKGLNLGDSNWRGLSRHRLLLPLLILLAAAIVYVWPASPTWSVWPLTDRQERAAPAELPDGAVPDASTLPPSDAPADLPDPTAPFAAPPGAADTPSAPASVVGGGADPAGVLPAVGAALVPAPVPAPVPTDAPVASLPVDAPPTLQLDPAGAAARAGRLTLSVREPAWVDVRETVSGRKVFSRLVQAGENLSVEGQSPLNVRVGNAQAVTLRFGGQPVDLAPYTRNNVARLELK